MISLNEWLLQEGKKDACYHKVKARYRVWPSAYACVPVETSKALTRFGWKKYNELAVGDEILTYSLEKQSLEFKPIQNLYYYEDAETWIVRNGNTGFKFECTPNHKWVVKHPACKGLRGRKKHQNLVNDMRLASIQELLEGSGSNRKLVISAPYDDGKPVMLDKIYKYQTNWIEYLLSCSKEQRQSWLFSAIVYDGNQKKTERLVEKTTYMTQTEYLFDSPHGKQSFGFKQKDVHHRDAFLLSAFLNKGIVTFRKVKNKDIYNCNFVQYNGTKSFEGFAIERMNKSTVWCPQTENGTWVMMQETEGHGIITITGNSGALVRCRKVGASNWGNSTQESTDHKFPTLQEYLNENKFKLEKERGLKGWFDRNKGKGWIDCKASKKGHLVPCGRQKTGPGAERKYPACRPTLSMCTASKHKKKSSKIISWGKK